ncbi:uncharacterized protein FA14DRAFT_62081 [Meira miltonrushii]|uniref:N-terminal of MaoC-like dehydratase domain-containing protein n=1 Tax=Meira miltonrushii TaxID=1280837 RepID=A0A316V8R8_9BASI|nr:uncharacterized protein FA14DRAFT_62081 [Meira miltonrushii]PWN33428.1 hypothetical protein FA14DRAFT_62081 [Meira miltonrushii]
MSGGIRIAVRHSANRWANQSCSLPRLPHRLISTTTIIRSKEGKSSANYKEWASKEAIEALEGFKARYADLKTSDGLKPASTFYQQIDANQIHLLRITQANMVPLNILRTHLGSHGEKGSDYETKLREYEEDILTGEGALANGILANGIPTGSLVIPTEHLAFFTPRVSSTSLGLDGSDTPFNPPGGIFTRRMWAGGRMEWTKEANDPAKRMKVGDQIWEKTFVEEAELKKLGDGGEMILVWARKEFGQKDDLETPVLIDKRSWIYRRALDPSKVKQSETPSINLSKPDLSSLTPPEGLQNPTLLFQTPANLFRYSALTFNAHAIHLSPPWAQNVEGHQGIVVHGPLNLSLLIRKWGREIAGWRLSNHGEFKDVHPTQDRRVLKSVDYRAKKPVYAEQPYWIGILEDKNNQGDHQHTVVAMQPDGKVLMEATITSEVEIGSKA